MSAKSFLAGVLLACSMACQSSPNLCGRGGQADFDGHSYCYYSEGITEEGFHCPPSLPHQLQVDGFRVCAPDETLPPGLEAYLRDKLPDAGLTGCQLERECAPPSGVGGDQICVAGRVFDPATRAPIDAATADQIEVRFYEPLNFLADSTTPPLRVLSLANGGLDSCGRFMGRLSVSQDTPNGLLHVVTTGRLSTPGEGGYFFGVTQMRPFANQNQTQHPAFLVSKAQNMAWSEQAGLVADDFAAHGTLAVRFHAPPAVSGGYFPGAPIAGISASWPGVPTPRYFADASPDTLLTIAPAQTSTGRNGVAFLPLGKGIGNPSAVAGSAGTCTKSDGTSGTLIITGPTLSGATQNAIVFFDLEATCN